MDRWIDRDKALKSIARILSIFFFHQRNTVSLNIKDKPEIS